MPLVEMVTTGILLDFNFKGDGKGEYSNVLGLNKNLKHRNRNSFRF